METIEPGAVTSEGQRLFREFLADHGITNTQAAEALGIDKSTVTLWIRNGISPGLVHRRAIDRFTQGAVHVNAWETDKERTLVERVKPFRPALSSEVVG